VHTDQLAGLRNGQPPEAPGQGQRHAELAAKEGNGGFRVRVR